MDALNACSSALLHMCILCPPKDRLRWWKMEWHYIFSKPFNTGTFLGNETSVNPDLGFLPNLSWTWFSCLISHRSSWWVEDWHHQAYNCWDEYRWHQIQLLEETNDLGFKKCLLCLTGGFCSKWDIHCEKSLRKCFFLYILTKFLIDKMTHSLSGFTVFSTQSNSSKNLSFTSVIDLAGKIWAGHMLKSISPDCWDYFKEILVSIQCPVFWQAAHIWDLFSLPEVFWHYSELQIHSAATTAELS